VRGAFYYNLYSRSWTAAGAISGAFWMRWGLLVTMFAVIFAIAGIYALLSRIDLSAIQRPGKTGEYLRTKVTRTVIRRRAAREEIPPPPVDRETSMSISAGKNLYDMHCASCHGSDENGPTPVGRGMLPRTVALNSNTLQTYSDRELFSIIRDGVRFTGMPGFFGTETNEQIWNLIDYIHSLP
jgi:cytochrome c553